MLSGLLSRLSELGDLRRERFDGGDYRLATAGLMVHVASVTGSVSQATRYRLETVLGATFALRPSDARRLVATAIESEAEMVDISAFTEILNRLLDRPERHRIVAMARDLIRLDGTVNECGEAIVDRAAELMGLPVGERVSA